MVDAPPRGRADELDDEYDLASSRGYEPDPSRAPLALVAAEALGAARVRRRALWKFKAAAVASSSSSSSSPAPARCSSRSRRTRSSGAGGSRRARRAALRPRDGTRARGAPPGPAVERAALHPVPRRAHHDEGAAARRVARGAGRARGADHRDARRLRVLARRRGARIGLLHGDGVRRLLPQPVQPAADRAARRRPRGRGAPPAFWLVGLAGLAA